MAATDYGRAGATKSQSGRGMSKYKTFQPLNVEERLTTPELEEYKSAIQALGRPAQLSRSGAVRDEYLRQQQDAMDQAYRLRSLAASRAFSDFSQSAMQYSKPWLAPKPAEGLISGQNIAYGLANRPISPMLSFAGEGVRAAPPPGQMALMGQYQFRPITYQEAATTKKRKKLSEMPYAQGPFSAAENVSQPSTLAPIDFGNLNIGRY